MTLFFGLLIPIPTDTTIIFPYHASKAKFDRTRYSSALTEGRTSSEEIGQVLSALEIVARGVSAPDVIKTWCTRFAIPLIFILFLFGHGVFHHPFHQLILHIFWLYFVFGSAWLVLSQSKKDEKAIKDGKMILEWYEESFQQRGLR